MGVNGRPVRSSPPHRQYSSDGERSCQGYRQAPSLLTWDGKRGRLRESMRDTASWTATKYVFKGKELRGSRDPRFVGVESRLITDLVAAAYQRNLPSRCRGRLLDLGCGSVPLYGLYQSLPTTVVCADWGNSLHSNAYLDVLCDVNQPLPFADGSFDVVVLSDVLEHIAEPGELISEIARVLIVGGNLLMSVPFLYWIHEAPHDYFRYTEFALRRLLERAGLRVISVESLGGLPEVLADLTAKGLVRLPVLGRAVAALLQNLVGFIGRHRNLSSLTSRTSRIFPLEYFVIAAKSAAVPDAPGTID